MIVWRLVSWRWASAAYSGEGSRLAPGRWNERGVPIAYAAEHLSLAVLEVLVHLDRPPRPLEMAAVPAEIPDELIETLSLQDLPPDWRASNAVKRLRRIGGEWMKSARSVGYLVPSAVVPEERLLLINPEHPAAIQVEIGEPLSFRFDDRLIGVGYGELEHP